MQTNCRGLRSGMRMVVSYSYTLITTTVYNLNILKTFYI